MANPFSKTQFSFQTKVLVPVVSIFVLLMLITTWVVDRRITKQFEIEAQERLARSEAVFKSFQEIRTEHLISRYRNLANEPNLKAISQLAVTQTNLDGSAEMAETLNKHFNKLIADLDEQKFGADIILFTSETPNRSARSVLDRSINLEDFEKNTRRSVHQVFNDQRPSEDIVPTGNRLFNVVSVPVTVSSHVVGVVTFANEIGDKVASDFSQMTGSQIVFLANGSVLVSTLSNLEQQKQFNDNLPEFIKTDVPQPEMKTVRGGAKILLGNEHFFWRANNFETAQGETKFRYILLSSYEDPWRTFQETQKMLFWVRLAGLAFASLIVWWLIRKVTQPLRELRDGAEAVGRGDFSRRVNVSSNDEYGDLAKSFNQMTENVKHSREELEKTVETLKTTRAQLVQSEKLSAIGEFVAGVAHELNNPLTAVIGFAELLQMSDADEKQKTFSKRIVQSAERCHKIVHNLLSFARQHTPERKQVNPNEIIESVIDILQYDLRTSNVHVTKRLHADLPPLLADGHQLQQVFLNIINNARQAMDGQSKASIEISTEVFNDVVRISFRDTGPGISEENLSKIFNPFFTTKPIGKGTGLGLSLSYGIIQEHGGKIVAKSKPGHGTTFTIELPVVRDAFGDSSSQKQNPNDTFPEITGKRILVIDDEESILELACEALQTCGCQVDIVQDGEKALQYLQSNSYDVVISDWKMPGLNGQEVFERLRIIKPDIAKRMVFMTGDIISDKINAFLKEHNLTCISKPFSVQEIRKAVRNFQI